MRSPFRYSARFLLPCLLLCLLCSCTAAPSSGSVASVPVVSGGASASLLPPAASVSSSIDILIPDEDYFTYPDYPYADEAALLVNQVLTAYADGSFPEPIIYHSDVFGFNDYPPMDCVLPLSVTGSSLGSFTFYKDYVSGGPFGTVCLLPLDNNYALEATLSIKEENGLPGVPYYVSEGGFIDTLPPKTAGTTPAATGGSFDDLWQTRLICSADFHQLTVPGMPGKITGSITWQTNRQRNFVRFYIDEMEGYDRSFFYTYFIEADGSFTQDYPTPALYEYSGSPFTDAEMLPMAQAMLAQFQTALADADWQTGSTTS